MKYNSQYIDGAYLDQILLERYFTNTANGFFIECGANDGITDSNCKLFEDNFDWKGLNLEPAVDLYNKLTINRPNSININKALSDVIGDRKFYYPLDCYNCGSLDNLTEFAVSVIGDLNANKNRIQEYSVKTTTYCDLIKEYNVKKIDLFSLDVEGHEINVISNMLQSTVLPRIICIEYGHCGIDNINSILCGGGYKNTLRDSVNCVFCLNT